MGEDVMAVAIAPGAGENYYRELHGSILRLQHLELVIAGSGDDNGATGFAGSEDRDLRGSETIEGLLMGMAVGVVWLRLVDGETRLRHSEELARGRAAGAVVPELEDINARDLRLGGD